MSAQEMGDEPESKSMIVSALFTVYMFIAVDCCSSSSPIVLTSPHELPVPVHVCTHALADDVALGGADGVSVVSASLSPQPITVLQQIFNMFIWSYSISYVVVRSSFHTHVYSYPSGFPSGTM